MNSSRDVPGEEAPLPPLVAFAHFGPEVLQSGDEKVLLTASRSRPVTPGFPPDPCHWAPGRVETVPPGISGEVTAARFNLEPDPGSLDELTECVKDLLESGRDFSWEEIRDEGRCLHFFLPCDCCCVPVEILESRGFPGSGIG